MRAHTWLMKRPACSHKSLMVKGPLTNGRGFIHVRVYIMETCRCRRSLLSHAFRPLQTRGWLSDRHLVQAPPRCTGWLDPGGGRGGEGGNPSAQSRYRASSMSQSCNLHLPLPIAPLPFSWPSLLSLLLSVQEKLKSLISRQSWKEMTSLLFSASCIRYQNFLCVLA